MTEYKRLPAGKYGTSKVAGLEIIKYLEPKQQADGSIRHSFLVKALMPSREQTELIMKAQQNGGKNNPYLDEPDFDGTQFLGLNLRNEWLTPAIVAVVFNREPLYLQQKKVSQDQLDAANSYLAQEAATSAASLNPDNMEAAVAEDMDRLKQTIQIRVGTLFRLQKWAGKTEDETTLDMAGMNGWQFSGEVTERDGRTGTFYDVRVAPKK